MDIILFLLLGIGVGTFGTLVGIGGGLICVPIFILFLSDGGVYPYFHTAAQIAGTSLVVVMANAMSGTLAYIRQKRVLFSAAIPFAIATLPGAVLGSWIVNKFSTPMLDLYFGIFLLLMSIIMYWNSTHKPVSNVMDVPKDFQYNRTLGIVASLGVGFLSSIFGIGGGVIHVPLMIYLLGFPVHVATATSHFVLACSSAFGVISHRSSATSCSTISSGSRPSASRLVPPSAHRLAPNSRRRRSQKSSSCCSRSPCSPSASV